MWENYVIAQGCTAALGLVPSYAQALGVQVDRYNVTLVVQAPDGSPADADEDIEDIRSALETLLGPEARVTVEVVRTPLRRRHPADGVGWFYAAASDAAAARHRPADHTARHGRAEVGGSDDLLVVLVSVDV